MIRRALGAGLVGVAGFVVAWGGWHLWLDHQAHHALLDYVQAQIAQAQKAAK